MCAMEDMKKTSTMFWVQASAFTLQQMHPESIESQEWFYIPRPSLNSSRACSSEGSKSSSSERRGTEHQMVRGTSLSLISEQSTLPVAIEHQPIPVHATSISSEASSTSSQLSGNSGQLLVERKPSWFPAHPPPLQVIPKDDLLKEQDPELGMSRNSDGDNISLASSMHFTVVGSGNATRHSNGGCCSHSHRLTALVLTMSLIFLAGISAAVILLEMRARHMS